MVKITSVELYNINVLQTLEDANISFIKVCIGTIEVEDIKTSFEVQRILDNAQ